MKKIYTSILELCLSKQAPAEIMHHFYFRASVLFQDKKEQFKLGSLIQLLYSLYR